jgi:hypothetical protein
MTLVEKIIKLINSTHNFKVISVPNGKLIFLLENTKDKTSEKINSKTGKCLVSRYGVTVPGKGNVLITKNGVISTIYSEE